MDSLGGLKVYRLASDCGEKCEYEATDATVIQGRLNQMVLELGWDGTKKGQDAAEQGDKEVEGNLLSSPPLFSGTTPSSPDLAWVVDFPCS